jgi:hypothetical protein
MKRLLFIQKHDNMGTEQGTVWTLHASLPFTVVTFKSITEEFVRIYDNQPLGLVEKESTSVVVNPKPEPLPKPVPLLDMLISLKLFSILPDPIDVNGPKPPLSPLFFSI